MTNTEKRDFSLFISISSLTHLQPINNAPKWSVVKMSATQHTIVLDTVWRGCNTRGWAARSGSCSTNPSTERERISLFNEKRCTERERFRTACSRVPQYRKGTGTCHKAAPFAKANALFSSSTKPVSDPILLNKKKGKKKDASANIKRKYKFRLSFIIKN